MIRVRNWVQERFLPVVTQHYRDGTFPTELVPELAQLGAFRPEHQRIRLRRAWERRFRANDARTQRGDSGLRTFASVQGSLAMMAINLFGSEEQKNRSLPAMARGEKLGRFALTEPDFGFNPGGLCPPGRKTPNGFASPARRNGSATERLPM